MPRLISFAPVSVRCALFVKQGVGKLQLTMKGIIWPQASERL